MNGAVAGIVARASPPIMQQAETDAVQTRNLRHVRPWREAFRNNLRLQIPRPPSPTIRSRDHLNAAPSVSLHLPALRIVLMTVLSTVRNLMRTVLKLDTIAHSIPVPSLDGIIITRC